MAAYTPPYFLFSLLSYFYVVFQAFTRIELGVPVLFFIELTWSWFIVGRATNHMYDATDRHQERNILER